MFGAVILVALAVGALVAQLRAAHMSRRTMSDAALRALLHELPEIAEDKFFALETSALRAFDDVLGTAYGNYFANMVADETAANEIRAAINDLLFALHLPMLKRAYDVRKLSRLIAALQRLHRLRASNLIGDPKDDSACTLLQCGVAWLKTIRHRANTMS